MAGNLTRHFFSFNYANSNHTLFKKSIFYNPHLFVNLYHGYLEYFSTFSMVLLMPTNGACGLIGLRIVNKKRFGQTETLFLCD